MRNQAICPTCEVPVDIEDFNPEADECKECHYQSPLDYAECGCDDCFQKLVAKADFTEID